MLLTNGMHDGSRTNASDAKPPVLPPEAVIADISTTADSMHSEPEAAAEAAAEGEVAPQPDVQQQLADVSLSQDLDSGSEPAAAAEPAEPSASNANGSATG